MTLHIALYQPDIPGNTGTILRLGACLGLVVDIIEPAGFDLSDQSLKRAGMDYLKTATLRRHDCWDDFLKYCEQEKHRLVLFTTKGAKPYTEFQYHDNDVLLFGRESAGVPDHVHQLVQNRVTIPMKGDARSINLAMSVAMAAGEAIRQIG